MVPDRGFELPFVNQARLLAVENERRVDCGGRERARIDIEQDLARANLARSSGFSGSLGPLENDSAAPFDAGDQLVLDSAAAVLHIVSVSSIPAFATLPFLLLQSV